MGLISFRMKDTSRTVRKIEVKPRAFKGTPGDAKFISENLQGEGQKTTVGEDKMPKTHVQTSLILKIFPG